MDCLIRNAMNADAPTISRIITGTLRESNAQDYSSEIINQVEQSFSAQAILRLLKQRRVLVAILDGPIVATASLDQDVVRSVFVEPAYQGRGIARQLMARIQSVAITEGLNLLRVPSSITAEGFYASLGLKKFETYFTSPSAPSSCPRHWISHFIACIRRAEIDGSGHRSRE